MASGPFEGRDWPGLEILGRQGCSCHVVCTVFSSRGFCSAGCMNWGRALGVLLGGGATLLLSFLCMPALLPVASRLLLLPRALLSMASGSPPSQPSPASGSGYVPGSVSAAFVTCPNEKVAKEIARAVVEKRLAACVNLIPQITSILVSFFL
ncbi:protein CutA isoform X3 [Rattus rattus]|uniref:protein CutA isoform X3 n=1 Tax=Rattus rattus TaxID=10117 RepID=UPI0013F2E015|nr:protein CutA isoform X3 [Rattus rattus]